MKKIIRLITLVTAIFCFLILSLCTAASFLTPSDFSVSPDSGSFCCGFPLTLDYGDSLTVSDMTSDSSAQGRILLFGSVPVKNVNITFTERRSVILGGQPFGIRLYTDGLVVAGTTSVPTASGDLYPAETAGIRPGDIIISANGVRLENNEQLTEAVELSGGKSIAIVFRRDNTEHTVFVTPARDFRLKCYRIGLWIRDSCAGIGTLTFYDPVSMVFAGLGHGIYDSSTGSVMPVSDGEIVNANIFSVEKSTGGHPGTLVGSLDSGHTLGNILANDECGLYGRLSENIGEKINIPAAFRQEVVSGKAQIRTSVEDVPEYFDIEIEDINYNSSSSVKNMVIHITDKRLLDKTGGIVQGMSGSPIIQNGKLVGAVTHVFINDPTHGYGIFAENMLSYCDTVLKKSTKSGI